MTAADNHYAFLGLEPSASHQEIESAIEHVSEQAIALVYTSPQRSSDLWERIRQMRRDLLASPEGRQVYDEALLRRQEMAGNAGTAPATSTPGLREPVEAVPVPLAGPVPTATTNAPAPIPDEEDQRAVAWPYALIAAAAVFVAVAGALLAHGPGGSPEQRPVAMTLSQLGARHSSKFVSGGFVTLAWTKVPHASEYRVQIATALGDPSDAAVFAHGSRIVTVTTPEYHLKVTGPQLYYWRVQAVVGTHRQKFSPSVHFAVAQPRITRPVALAPVTGSAEGGKHARLCWSPVQGAVGYRLRIQGQASRTVRGTCTTLSVQPRTYHWSVAALVKGVGVYTGSYSVAAVLHIHSTHRATTKVRTKHHSTRHVPTRRSSVRSGIAAISHHKSSRPVEIALALPRRATSSSSRTKAQSVSTSAQSTLSTHRRAVHTLGRVAKPSVTRGRTVSATASRKVAGAQVRTTPPHPAATRVRHTPNTRHASASPTHLPSPPSTPAKKATAVVASRVPAPPAPPAVPATGSAQTVAAPTQGVTTSGASTSTSPIYVRPIVAPQIATTTSGSGTPPTATSTSPGVRSTSPAPTSTTAIPPASTPVQTSTNQHSEHPARPDPPHPVRPARPDPPRPEPPHPVRPPRP